MSHGEQFGFAALLDYAFQPSKINDGSKWVPQCIEALDRKIRELDTANSPGKRLDTRAQKSRDAEAIIKFIGTTIGSVKVVKYIDDFCIKNRPAIDANPPDTDDEDLNDIAEASADYDEKNDEGSFVEPDD